MATIVQKLDNNSDLLISRIIWEALKVSDKEKVEIILQNDELRIRKSEQPIHKSIEERLEAFYKKSVDDILLEQGNSLPNEYDWGKPMGKEI